MDTRRSRRPARLTHLDARGQARMVDVGGKPVTARAAIAAGRIVMGREAFAALTGGRIAKGDALALARAAGIAAAKRTADWIPLCHSVPLDHLRVEIRPAARGSSFVVEAQAAARWTTGVEMEALVAVSAALLTLYDMAKAIDRGMTIGAVRLLRKSGGRSGIWVRRAARRAGHSSRRAGRSSRRAGRP
jgi:cyclic pyranopterin phosphate synthase